MSNTHEINFYIDPLTGDFALTADGTNIRMTDSTTETVKQRVKSRLQTRKGEWFLNEEDGLPFFTEIMQKNPDITQVRAILLTVLTRTPGVKEVLAFDTTFTEATRTFNVQFKYLTTDGDIVEGTI